MVLAMTSDTLTNQACTVLYYFLRAPAHASTRRLLGRAVYSPDMVSKRKVELTDEQKCMYASETATNFRWISRLLAGHSEHVLCEKDLASTDLFNQLAEIGASVLHGYCIKLLTSCVRPVCGTCVWQYCSPGICI
jgi:hypothetical protein